MKPRESKTEKRYAVALKKIVIAVFLVLFLLALVFLVILKLYHFIESI